MPTEPTRHVIAIDGPAASGKSSVARALAKRLGFIYVNSGAMYRAVTWFVLENGLDPAAGEDVVRLVERSSIQCDLISDEVRLRVNGVDASAHLRDNNVNQAVSIVSALPRVRQILVDLMRGYARDHDVVVEGRDIASVVFPHTPFKFYIDASPEVRAQRRAAQGEDDAIIVRDKADSSRATAPLVVAKDAHVIDTSAMTIAEVVDTVVDRLRELGLTIGERSRASSRLH